MKQLSVSGYDWLINRFVLSLADIKDSMKSKMIIMLNEIINVSLLCMNH